MVSTEINETEYPYTGSFVALRPAQRMHYLDEGNKNGEVLLALHGNPTWSFYYRHVVRHFRNTHRIVVPDHIGCGFSDKPTDSDYSYRLEQRVEDVEKLVKHLGLTDITLVLHDWGGMIGLAFACRNPSLVKRIILMNSAGFPLPKSKPFPLALSLSRAPVVGSVLIRGFNAFALSASWIGCKRERMPTALRHAYRAPYHNWASRRAVHRFVQDIPLQKNDPSWPLVHFVDQNLEILSSLPFQIIWGERDFIFDKHFLAEWRRRMPGAEFHSFADAGHYILEDLGDEALSLMSSFLDRHPLSKH